LARWEGTEARTYGRTVVDRVSNEEIQDELARICAHASGRIAKFVLPVARAQTSQSGPVKICAAVVAGWARYAAGDTETGAASKVIDTKRESVVELAEAALSDPHREVAQYVVECGLLENTRREGPS
jgi:mannitol 2-dehydrogenase